MVGRFFHDDSYYASNINARPIDFAREIHSQIVNDPVTPLLDYVQSNNETNQDWEGIQRLNEYSFEWMNLADISGVYKCAILAFSVGNPDLPHKPGDPSGFDGRMLYWQQVLESLRYAQKHNHILLLHAYGYPDMFHPDADWHIYRYERQVQANLRTLGIANLKYAYGEIGIDRLIVGEKGGYKVVPVTDQGYTNQTLQWEKDLQGEDLLLGGAIFTLGDSGGWGTYDISDTSVASLIAQHYVDHAGDYDGSGSPNPAPPAKPRLVLGGRAKAVLPSNVRRSAGYSNKTADDILHILQPGAVITLNADPQFVDGLWWWRIGELNGGWVAESRPSGDALLMPYSVDDEDETVFIPGLGTGGQVMPAPTFQREMEQDAKDYGVKVEPFVAIGLKDGDLVWIAEKVERLHEAEGGGRHHFYFETVGENNQRLTGIPIRVWWSSGEDIVRSEAKPGEPYSANKPFSPGRNAFSALVVDGKASDVVAGAGMGQQYPEGFNANVHTSIVVRWVRRIFRAAVTTPPTPGPAPMPVPPNPTPAPSVPSGSILVMPCSGVVSQRWGENPQDYIKFGIPGHNGLDIANKAGTPIVAVADGVVAFVGVDTDYGNYVRIFHAQFGFSSFYAHLQSYQVSTGQHVKRSQQIGLMGSTGNSTGNHLHLEIRLTQSQDSYELLSGGYGKGRIDPEIAYHLLNRSPVPPSTTLVDIAAAAAREFGVDVRLFDVLVREESKYDPNVVSPAGAVGLAQIMPDTFAEWAPKVGATNIRDARDNARVGAAYLNFLAKYYKGDLRKALYAYNWGPGNVDSGRTPPPETIAYANRILGTQPL